MLKGGENVSFFITDTSKYRALWIREDSMSEKDDRTDQVAGMVSVPAKKKKQSGGAEIESWMMCFAPQKSSGCLETCRLQTGDWAYYDRGR